MEDRDIVKETSDYIIYREDDGTFTVRDKHSKEEDYGFRTLNEAQHSVGDSVNDAYLMKVFYNGKRQWVKSYKTYGDLYSDWDHNVSLSEDVEIYKDGKFLGVNPTDIYNKGLAKDEDVEERNEIIEETNDSYGHTSEFDDLEYEIKKTIRPGADKLTIKKLFTKVSNADNNRIISSSEAFDLNNLINSLSKKVGVIDDSISDSKADKLLNEIERKLNSIYRLANSQENLTSRGLDIVFQSKWIPSDPDDDTWRDVYKKYESVVNDYKKYGFKFYVNYDKRYQSGKREMRVDIRGDIYDRDIEKLGDSINDRLSNLELVTASENIRRMQAKLKGDSMEDSVSKEEKVAKIAKLLKAKDAIK